MGKKKKRGRNFGHFKGVETIKKIVNISKIFKIPIITFYVFSQENWKRPKSEIKFLFKLIESYFKKEIENVNSEGIKINIFGNITKLPSNLKKILNKCITLTKNNKKIIVNLAINYSSRNEILLAAKKSKKKINLRNFEKNLFFKNLPDPEILIRTGGKQRLSNFMLWQLAYTELFFLKKLWPDFTPADLKKILVKYKMIKRNFGSI